MSQIIIDVIDRAEQRQTRPEAQPQILCNYTDDYYGDQQCVIKPVTK